jgi:lysophospholipase L1-like esterase
VRVPLGTVLLLVAGLGPALAQGSASAPAFEPGAVWMDTDGRPIQAHGGGILYDKGTYYWFGENKDAPNATSETARLARIDAVGVSCYSSKDLVHWTNEGLVLPAIKDDPASDLHPSGVVERPKVVWNGKTRKYVMWLHIDSADYKKARAGVAVADRPTGPYRYVGSVRPDDGEGRDMTLFKDDDDKAYLVYASEGNATMHVSLLSDDYLKPVGKMVRIFEGQSREAPAVFKRNGLYYIVTSGCTGWYPNRAWYATAPKITGPWTVQENPLRGPDAEWTYFGQSTHVVPVAGKRDAYVLMLDRWKSTDLSDSRYLWLPIRFAGKKMMLEWWDRWDLSVFDDPTASSPAMTRVAPVRIGDDETIVFYGDSITEQNLYSAFLETFLLSRFPQKKLGIFNFGWGGDTVPGGNKRFGRDAAPVKPSLVFVNFGMNDGGYMAYDEPTFRIYMDAQHALADTIKSAGAREVLFTTSPIDDVLRGDNGVYNDTLSRMAWGVVSLARERQLPVIDLLHPMAEVQRLAREKNPGSTMIPDTVHPNAAGHLVMAYLAMRQIDAPHTVGEIEMDGAEVKSEGASVEHVTAQDGVVSFELKLPFLPFYVPQEARTALDLVPLEDDLNRFRLRVKPREGEQTLVLSIDGKTAGEFKAEELAKGIDLALLDKAPWAEAGQTLWETAQFRWKKHLEAWREMGLDKPAWMLPALPTFDPYVQAQRAYADDLGRSMSRLAQPGTYHVSLAAPGDRVEILSLELSPTYPFDDSFDAAHPPEQDPNSVTWTPAPVVNGQIDLAAHFTGASNVVSYALLVLEADRATTVHLALGSDDGVAVFLGGRRVFAHDVMRALHPGEDELDLPLAAGRNQVLFKVTQGGGGYGLAVDAQVRGKAKVHQVTAP